MKKTYSEALLNLIRLHGSRAFRDWLRMRADASVTKYADLPCSMLAGFNVSTGLRNILLDNPNDVQIKQVFRIIRSGSGTLGTRRVWTGEKRKTELSLACLSFLEMENTTEYRARPISENIAWIIPDSNFRDDGRLDDDFKLVTNHLIAANFDQYLASWDCWLPWMSLSISVKLKSWRSPKLNCVRRALFKLPRVIGLDCDVFEPWSCRYPKILSELPMPALYQCERDKKTLDALHSLTDIGLKKVNDLRIFHPDAISFAKDARAPHKFLYNTFNS